MTPNHQQIVDAVLTAMQRRVHELVADCQRGTMLSEQPLASLRDSPLGGHLAAIAHYAEGYAYPYEGDVRASVSFLARCLYGDSLAARGFRLPPKWQRSPVGQVVHAALLRFYEQERPGQLLTVTDMRKLFGVRRQTVHQWIDDGLLFAVYRGDTPLFYQKDVTRFQQARAHKQQESVN
jgi:hypothetical protein